MAEGVFGGAWGRSGGGWRASIYVRLSGDPDLANTSLGGHLADCRALVARLGGVEIGLHVDRGRSGALRTREGFRAWIEDARTGQANLLVAPNVARMTRSGAGVAAMLLELVDGRDPLQPLTDARIAGPVRVVSVDGLDSQDGRSFRRKLLEDAEVAREQREEAVRLSIERHKRLTVEVRRFPGGNIPHGYQCVVMEEFAHLIDPHNPQRLPKTLVPQPQEAAALQHAADMICMGESLSAVTRWLNGTIKPRRAGQWTNASVRNTLCSPHLLGYKWDGPDFLRDADGEPVEAYPPVLDVGTLLAVRQILLPAERPSGGVVPVQDLRRRPGRGQVSAGPRRRRDAGLARVAVRICSELLHCSSCMSVMHVSMHNGYPEYRCASKWNGRLCERQTTVKAGLIDAWAEAFILGKYGRLRYFTRRHRVLPDARRAEIGRELAEIGRAIQAGQLPDVARVAALQAEREALDAAGTPVAPAEVIDSGRSVAEEWAAREVSGRRDLLAALIPAAHPLVVGPRTRGFGRRGGFDPGRVVTELDAWPSAEDVAADVPDRLARALGL